MMGAKGKEKERETWERRERNNKRLDKQKEVGEL